jgi:hypothetical protein
MVNPAGKRIKHALDDRRRCRDGPSFTDAGMSKLAFITGLVRERLPLSAPRDTWYLFGQLARTRPDFCLGRDFENAHLRSPSMMSV